MNDRPNKFQERYLNSLRDLDAHKELAVAAALDFCAEDDIVAPSWATQASADLTRNLLKRAKSPRRGRAADPVARYRQDMWDFERWCVVGEIRRYRATNKRDAEIMKEYPQNDARYLKHHNKMRQWLRHGTFECASLYLIGYQCRSQAGADAVKASYRRVERDLRDRTKQSRYFMFDDRFLAKLGTGRLNDPDQVTKCVPIYDLTP